MKWRTPLPLMQVSARYSGNWSAPIFCTNILRSVGIVQSEHCFPSRPVWCDGRRAPLHPSLRAVGEGHISSLTFRSGTIAAGGTVTIDPTARLASIPKVHNRRPGPDGDDVEVVFKPDEHISERVIFPIRTPSQWHRGCPLRGIRRGRAKDILCDIYRLQRQDDQIRVDPDHRLHVLPDVATEGNRCAEQGHGVVPRKINGRYAMIGRQDDEIPT